MEAKQLAVAYPTVQDAVDVDVVGLWGRQERDIVYLFTPSHLRFSYFPLLYSTSSSTQQVESSLVVWPDITHGVTKARAANAS